MKRTLITIMCIFVALLPITNVFAADSNKYYIKEVGISIEIPAKYDVMTRDIKDGDQILDKYGYTKTSMMELFDSRNIYLDAVIQNPNNEIIVTMINSDLSDFANVSEPVLLTLTSALKTQYDEQGITVLDIQTYKHTQEKFVVIRTTQNNSGTQMYSTQYYTVNNGKAINITMHSLDGEMTSSKESELKTVVNSVAFDSVPETTTAPHTEAFLYTDNNTGTTFTVPENWSEAEFSKERKFLSGKFTYNNDEAVSILYGASDLRSALSGKGFQKSTNSSINDLTVNDFSEEYLTDMLGNSDFGELIESDKRYLGSEPYLHCIYDLSNTIGLNIEATSIIIIKNGYCFYFMFSGTESSDGYKDFISLIESVKYPEKSSDDNSIYIEPYQVVVFFVISLLLIVGAVILLNKKKKSSKKSEIATQGNNAFSALTPNSSIEKAPPIQQGIAPTEPTVAPVDSSIEKNDNIDGNADSDDIVEATNGADTDDSVCDETANNSTSAADDAVEKSEENEAVKDTDRLVEHTLNVGTVLEKLEKLSKLKEAGIINEVEFERLKKDILNGKS